MNTYKRPTRLAGPRLATIAAVGLGLAGAASAAASAAEPRVIPIRVLASGIKPARIAVKTGEPVVFEVSSDGPLRSLRIEAFGVRAVAPPGQIVRVAFTADHAGAFPVDCDTHCNANAAQASLVVAD